MDSRKTNLPVAGRNRQNMGQASIGFVSACIDAAKAFPKVPSGEIDVQVLEEKLATVQEMNKFLVVSEPLTSNAINIRRLHGQDLMSACNDIMRSFESSAKNNAEVKATAAQLKQRYARAKKEEAEAAKEAKAALNAAGEVMKTASNGVPA